MTETNQPSALHQPVPPELLVEFQSRFNIAPESSVEYHLFRIIEPSGPAQPVLGQIPIGATDNKEQAIEMADLFSDNNTVVIQRREWLVRVKKGKSWVWGPPRPVPAHTQQEGNK